jgi:hypothetical protein
MLAGMSTRARGANDELSEYQLKAHYIFNFASFTEWPADIGATITLCIYGPDPFDATLDSFEGRDIDGRSFQVTRINTVDQLGGCNIVFISNAMISNLPRVLDDTDGKAVLSIADSPTAALEGAGINMLMEEGKVAFEVNLVSLRNNGLDINFQLLRLASKVYQ